jgi:hypothetical protein
MTQIVGSPLRLENYKTPGLSWSDALEKAIADAESGIWSTCRITFGTQVKLTRRLRLSRVHIEGDDIYGSTLIKDYTDDPLFIYINGQAGWSGGGLHNFGVPATPKTPGSYTIYMAGQSGYMADGFRLEHLYLNSGIPAHAPYRNIHFDGSGRTSPSGSRVNWISNVTCFPAENVSVYMAGLNKLTAVGLNTYGNIPARRDGHVWCVSPNFQTMDVSIDGCDIEGNLQLQGLNCCMFRGSFTDIVWVGECHNTVVDSAHRCGVWDYGLQTGTRRIRFPSGADWQG